MNYTEDDMILEQLKAIQVMLNQVVNQLGGDVEEDGLEEPEEHPVAAMKKTLLAGVVR